MKLTPRLKKQIDGMSLETLLRKWRFAPVGDLMFQGESGEYFGKVMFSKRDADPAAWTAASKRIGWN